ncbi:hypothetical protein ACFQX4_02745 [Roseomonas sp. GCM10028921]
MAEPVVELLEPVHVHQREGEMASVLRGTAPEGLQGGVKAAAIRQPRQRVGARDRLPPGVRLGQPGIRAADLPDQFGLFLVREKQPHRLPAEKAGHADACHEVQENEAAENEISRLAVGEAGEQHGPEAEDEGPLRRGRQGAVARRGAGEEAALHREDKEMRERIPFRHHDDADDGPEDARAPGADGEAPGRPSRQPGRPGPDIAGDAEHGHGQAADDQGARLPEGGVGAARGDDLRQRLGFPVSHPDQPFRPQLPRLAAG